VFLDYMMPVMDGPATLRAMQSAPAYRAIPVVMMSSLPESVIESVIAGSCSGYRAFLRKPFLLRSVTDLIAEVIGGDKAG